MADVAAPCSSLRNKREHQVAFVEETVKGVAAATATGRSLLPPPATAPVPCRSLKRKRPLSIVVPPILREIPPGEVCSRSGKAWYEDDTRPGSASGPGWGVFSKRGRRKKPMEDAHRAISGHPHKSFFGVYDGHGGREAVDFVMENLHANVFEMMEEFDVSKVVESVKAGFLKTDRGFSEKGLGGGCCCVTAVLVEKKSVVVSNLGDCRAVLSRGGVAEALTGDHAAGREDEQERIRRKGGCVERHNGTWRVQGTLAVTRSVGDIHLKEWGVSAEPDSVVLPLVSDMELLILASDGLWGKVGNQEAVDIAVRANDGKTNAGAEEVEENQSSSYPTKLRKVEEGPDEEGGGGSTGTRCRLPRLSEELLLLPHPVAACKRLARIAMSRGSTDDITVMIVDLTHFLRS